MGKHQDVQPRTRKAATPAELAARSRMNAGKAAGKKKKDVEAAAAARERMQASLLGGSRPRASGAGSSSQDIGGAAAASDSAEAAASDRAAGSVEPPAVATDDVLEEGEVVQYYDKRRGSVIDVVVQTVHRDAVPAYYTIRLGMGQHRETQRELLWREGEAPPPTARAGAPADAAHQARAYVA
mgnify:FL=1|jgi:hypothetical protein